MANHGYFLGIKTDEKLDLNDSYLVVAPNRRAAKELLKSKLTSNEEVVGLAMWRDDVVTDRIRNHAGRKISLKSKAVYRCSSLLWA